jgi:hypothetical protein
VKAILAVIKDGKRSQRGSVLSGVLIITAFIAIISGALMTALSTNFLLSHNLAIKVANEASIDSAVELAISQLQDTTTTPISLGCPTPPSTVNLNARTVVPAYSSCWPTIPGIEPQFAKLKGTSSSAFNVDGTHAQIGALDDYVVANSAGMVFDYPFGATAPRWTLPLRGAITAPPLVMQSTAGSAPYLDLIPLSGADCAPATYCLNVRGDNGSRYTPPASPPRACVIGTGRAVTTRPAASPTLGGIIYFAYGPTLEFADISGGGGGCDVEERVGVSLSLPVVAGPLALTFDRWTDYVYAVLSNGSSSSLIRCTYHSGLTCTPESQLPLPLGNPVGLAASGKSLPAMIAITYTSGVVALVKVASSGMTLVASPSTGAPVARAPYWCAECGNLIGVAAQDGLHLYDSSLSPIAKYTGAGLVSRTTPIADAAGNWYFATEDGYVHELQLQSGILKQVNAYGPLGQIGSSPQLGACPYGVQRSLCIYLGSLNTNAYLVPLDAREVVITACISKSPPACQSGANPRLSARVQVGSFVSNQTVHVQGWSYYSG